MWEMKRVGCGLKTLSLLHCSGLGGWLSHGVGRPIGSTREKFLGILQLCRNDAELSFCLRKTVDSPPRRNQRKDARTVIKGFGMIH